MRSRPLILFVYAAATASCGGSGSTPTPDGGTTIRCQDDERISLYAPNLPGASETGVMTFVLLESNPAPPARGNNTWSIRITDSGGQPLTDLTLTVTAFMPDHGHGSSVTPQVTSQGDGVYQIAPLHFFMPGVWRITIAAMEPGGASDIGTYFFCIAG